MANRRKRKLEEATAQKADMEMTPMIDVTFLLLIFFMCTIKFKTLEGKLSAYLPKDVGSNTTDAEPKEKVEIRIKVEQEGSKLDPESGGPWTGQGPFKYGPDRVLVYSVGPRSTRRIEDLARRLGELYRVDPEGAVTIAPHPGTVYEDVIGVLDECVLIGFGDITFMGAIEN